ncbi:hypothetical protein AB5I41_12165 [Sphingomonas sp. MMS24-JH45]
MAVVIDTGDDARTAALGLGIADHYAAAGLAAPPIHVRLSAAREGLTGASLRAFGRRWSASPIPSCCCRKTTTRAGAVDPRFLPPGSLDKGEALGARASLTNGRIFQKTTATTTGWWRIAMA